MAGGSDIERRPNLGSVDRIPFRPAVREPRPGSAERARPRNGLRFSGGPDRVSRAPGTTFRGTWTSVSQGRPYAAGMLRGGGVRETLGDGVAESP